MHIRRTTLGLALALTTCLLGGAGAGLAGAAAAAGPTAEGTWRAPGHTIVRVSGDAGHGFTIHHKDGTALHPPTRSEADAECSEYDTSIERVRCRTEVRVWYRDLADMKTAIAWAKYSARR